VITLPPHAHAAGSEPAVPLDEPAAAALIDLLPRTARGPRREGLFALWLTLRVAEDLLADPPAERAHRRRLAALEQRLSSLTIPPPLRRALVAALAQIREPRAEAAAHALAQLVAPARESTGADAGEVVTRAARRARAVVHAGRAAEPASD
jgi:hypothetical protein